MKVSLILFQVGAGGNFLSRVLTLDESTVPVGGYIEQEFFLSTNSRLERYHYRNVVKEIGNNYKILDSGITTWVDFELNKMFLPLTIGIEELVGYNQHVIEFVHPHDYKTKIELFGSDDDVTTYYLDSGDSLDWVYKQASTKSTVKYMKDVVHEYDQLVQIAKEYNMKKFSLHNILNSFVDEYNLMCKTVGCKPHIDQAVTIYNSWKQTWAK